MSLASRHLEANGIPTVILGSARDIVEQAAVARFVFTDFPLGNSVGKPFDVEMQRSITGMGLNVLEEGRFPRTTWQTPFRWDDDAWRAGYMRVDDSNVEELRRAGDQRRQRQSHRKAEGVLRVD